MCNVGGLMRIQVNYTISAILLFFSPQQHARQKKKGKTKEECGKPHKNNIQEREMRNSHFHHLWRKFMNNSQLWASPPHLSHENRNDHPELIRIL